MVRKFRFPISVVLSGLVLLSLAAGLGGPRRAAAADPELESAITSTVRAAVHAYNQGDAGSTFSIFTDKGFEEEFFVTKEDVLADDEVYRQVFSDPVALRAVRDVMATDSGASATVDFEAGLGIHSEELSFVYVDSRWRIDGSRPGSGLLEAGTTLVDMKLQEYAFVYDEAAVAGGDIAFNVENVGEQEHELVVLKLDGSVPLGEAAAALFEAFESDSEPDFLEDSGFLGFLAPGESKTSVLSHPLAEGSYLFVCFVPDAEDGVPHAAKGMISGFTVGEAGGSITPPSTGDAGLLAGGRALNPGLIGIGLTLVALGLGSALSSASRSRSRAA